MFIYKLQNKQSKLFHFLNSLLGSFYGGRWLKLLYKYYAKVGLGLGPDPKEWMGCLLRPCNNWGVGGGEEFITVVEKLTYYQRHFSCNFKINIPLT